MTQATADDTLFVRERLIRGATSLIEKEGCSALGVRRLAQAADRSSMCVYSKFGSRGGLLAAVYDRVSRDLLTTLVTAYTKDSADAYCDWARNNPELYALLFDQPLDALDVDASVRRDLLADVVGVLSGKDAGDGVAQWARLHGEISHERIMGA